MGDLATEKVDCHSKLKLLDPTEAYISLVGQGSDGIVQHKVTCKGCN